MKKAIVFVVLFVLGVSSIFALSSISFEKEIVNSDVSVDSNIKVVEVNGEDLITPRERLLTKMSPLRSL